MIEIKTFAKPKKTGGSSGSSSSTKYISGVISEAEHAARADKAKRAEVADQANYAGTAASAQNAAYASEAGNIREDAEILQQYLSLKDTVNPQVVNGMVIFAKGLISNLLAQLKGGASFGSDGSYSFDKDGNLVIESARSRDFDEMLQNGFALKRNPTSGKYTLSISDLIVWGRMVINTLEIRKKYAIGGNVYLSGASSKIQHVEKVYSEDGETVVGYKCYILKDDGTMATQNNWVVGDQALCQTFDIEEGVYQNVSNQYYWRLVTQVSEENVAITEKYIDKDGNEQIRELYEGQKFAWVVLSKDDCDTNSGIPASGDTIVLDGHRLTENEDTDYTERTNVLMLEATGSGSPRIIALTGVVDYKHTTDNEVFILSPRKVIFTTEHFEIRTASGAPITFVHFMGPWVKDTEYHYYDQVSHANALWTCIVEKGKSTTAEPTDGSTYWRKEMSGGKGEKGDKGDDGLSGNGIVPVYTRSEGTPTPPTSADKNNLDNGWSLTIPSVADVENVSYGDSSWTDYNDDSGCTWKKSPTTAASSTSSCLVTFTTTQANQVVKFVIKSFSEPRYDYIFLSEIDAASVPSRPTSNGRSRAVSGNGVELSVTDIIATAGTHTVYVCYGKDMSGDFHGDYGLFRIESAAGIPLWQSNGKEVFTREDSGAIKSEIESWSEPFKVTGEDGADGKDAVSYTVTLTRGSNGVTQGLYVGVTRYIGTACTTGTIISFGMSCKAYTNGTLAEGLTDRLQTTDNYIDFAAFPEAKSFTVELFDKNGNKVATGNYSAGDDAISILVEDAPLVFDTDDNGIVSSNVTKTAKVKVMKGNTNVTNDCSGISSMDSMCVNCKCSAAQKDKYIEISISGDDIIKNDVIVDDVNQGQVSTTSGYAVAQLTYDGVTYFAQVPFSVNVAKFTGVVAFNNKSCKIQFDELSKNAATKDELTKATSKFEQTAREISLSVSEKTIGRRNLLVGSAFLRDDNNRVLSDGARIEMNSGYQGTNCIKVIDKTKKGDLHYIGVYWDGSQGGRSIKIEKGKKYTLSCYYKTKMSLAMLSIEAIYTDKQENATRLGQVNYLSPNSFRVKKANEWELFTTVIDTTDAKSDYIAFNFWEACKFTAGTINAWICRPMVEEGDTYNGWTLSEKDYDIIGANLIDNSRTLDAGGNIVEAKGKKTLVGDVYELTASGSDDYNQFYRIKGDTFKLDTDYTISFEVRGDTEYIQVDAFYPANNTKYTCYIEQQNNVMSETAGDGTTVGYVTLGEFEVLPKQQKVWAHFRFKDRLPEELYFQFTKNAEQTDVTSWNVTITRPKIEVGAVVTEYTERKSDLVDKASLKAAGINITSDMVELYGNQVKVSGAKGGTPVAMFEDGMLNANLINAEKVVAEGIKTQELEAQNLKVTGNSQLGIFQIKTSSGDGRDNYTIDGDMITYSGSYKLPDGTTTITSGDGLAYLMYKPLFIRQGAPDVGKYMRLGNCYTEWDDCLTGNGDSYLFNGVAARYVCSGNGVCKNYGLPMNLSYYDSYFPVSYIYSTKSSPNDPAFAINVQQVKGTTGERTAIQTNAAIRGVLAPNSMSANYSQTIPNGIGVVICTNGYDITLTLPANPLEGQTLIIIQGSTSRVSIIPYGDEKIYCHGETRDKNTKFYSETIGQFNIFVYVRGAWQLQWMNYKP